MTVGELKEKLEDFDDELEVWIMGSHYEPMRQVEQMSDVLRGEDPDRVVIS